MDTLKIPIEYGGMNVPDIQSLIDAARIRWIKKITDDQTPLIWRNLAIHMMNRACDSNIGLNIFRHPERKVVQTRNPHLRHWLFVLKAWRRLEGQGITAPKTLDEIRSIHLTEIDAKIGKQLTKHNYNTIDDILAPETTIDEPKYIASTQLVKCAGQRAVTAKTYQELINKLPTETTIPDHIMDSKQLGNNLQGDRTIFKTKEKQKIERQRKNTCSTCHKTKSKGTKTKCSRGSICDHLR